MADATTMCIGWRMAKSCMLRIQHASGIVVDVLSEKVVLSRGGC